MQIKQVNTNINTAYRLTVILLVVIKLITNKIIGTIKNICLDIFKLFSKNPPYILKKQVTARLYYETACSYQYPIMILYYLYMNTTDLQFYIHQNVLLT